jgi:hypothetical protein
MDVLLIAKIEGGVEEVIGDSFLVFVFDEGEFVDGEVLRFEKLHGFI